MGLDMYLYAKRYMWRDDELATKISENFPELDGARISTIQAEVGYWRKANAVHKWFVDNVQAGVDDCGNYEVSFEALEALLEIVEQVLADRDNAATILPTTSGFFFGETQYNDWYFEDMEHTRSMLKKLIDKKDQMAGWYFEYHSSW